MNNWKIEGGDGYLSGNENPSGGGVVSNNSTSEIPDSVIGPAVSTGTGMLLSNTPVSEVPGLVGLTAGAAGDLATGKNAGQIAKNTGMRGLKTAASYGMQSAGVPGYIAGPGVSVGMANVMESQRANPNYGRATIGSGIPSTVGTVASLFGGPLVGLVAGIVADVFTRDSLADGGLGDWTDSRTHEWARDDLEDQGSSYNESASAVSNDNDLNSGYDVNNRDNRPDQTNTFSNPNVYNYDPGADNPSGGFDSVGSGYGDEAADAASEDSGLGSMY